MKTKVEVKELPELKLAHIRHQGAYSDIGKVFQKLTQWAMERGLLDFPKTKMASIFYDSPRVTEASKLQSSACISIEDDIETSGEVGQITIPKGKFAVGSFEIKMEEFEQAWNSMALWVPENDFKVRGDGYYHEIYHNDGNQHPEGLFFVDICIPIQ